jgi:hypothetical protein
MIRLAVQVFKNSQVTVMVGLRLSLTQQVDASDVDEVISTKETSAKVMLMEVRLIKLGTKESKVERNRFGNQENTAGGQELESWLG